MRNVVLAHALARDLNVSAAVIAAFADAPNFHTAHRVRSSGSELLPGPGKPLITPLSYQSIIAMTQSLSRQASDWGDLAAWVNRKIEHVLLKPRHKLRNHI
ncbi:hypothetical protein [Bradyrhizobium liaoningense]|uniref:hypothetical protein n=1 Tax=Bradyrhizobium liaoningense TaxID=43992 RepID=UPI0020110699|nr:hypothetical protein [Bradyrhizobium liaoningense]